MQQKGQMGNTATTDVAVHGEIDAAVASEQAFVTRSESPQVINTRGCWRSRLGRFNFISKLFKANKKAPLVAVKVGEGVEDGALLAVALGLATQQHLWRARVRLAHPVAPVVLLLLRQVAPAAVHLRSQQCAKISPGFEVMLSKTYSATCQSGAAI